MKFYSVHLCRTLDGGTARPVSFSDTPATATTCFSEWSGFKLAFYQIVLNKSMVISADIFTVLAVITYWTLFLESEWLVDLLSY